MAQVHESAARNGIYDPLAAALSKIPQERQEQVRRDAAIFIAGMEASSRAVQAVQPMRPAT